MKRITTQEVIEAFQETGLKPMRGDYYPFPGCACALGAISAQRGFKGNVYYQFKEMYGDYQDAFTLGFDGKPIPLGGFPENEEIAYQDGVDAWEAVKRLAHD